MTSRNPDSPNYDVPDYPMSPHDPPARQITVPPKFKDQIIAWYHQFLGPNRTPSDAEIQSHYQNPSGLDGAYGAIANSKEASDYKIAQANGTADTGGKTTTTATGGDAGATWDALAAKAGIKDGGPGSGFADRAYWVAHPSEITNGRYASDLAGTGPDQPDGTPGTGVWQNSGAADRKAGKVGPTATGGAAANYVKGQRYTIDQVPGATQYAPNAKGNIYTDGKNNYFQADGTGGATYHGTDPSVFTTTGATGQGPSLADLAKLATVGGGYNGAPTSTSSLGMQMANTALPQAAKPMTAGAPSLMDLAKMGGVQTPVGVGAYGL